MAGKKGSKHYPLELKLEAMRMFYEEGKTRKEITEALGIRDRDRVMKWLRRYHT
jgi:transposase-like protein